MRVHEVGITRCSGAFILGTSELFIYKCLTSRRRLDLPSSFFYLDFSLPFSGRVIYARPGYTAVAVARGYRGGRVTRGGPRNQSAKEGSREDELSRCLSNEPLLLQRSRCYEKERHLRHPQASKKRRETKTGIERGEGEKERKRKCARESRRNDFVELTLSHCAEARSDRGAENIRERAQLLPVPFRVTYILCSVLIFTVDLSPSAFCIFPNSVLTLSDGTSGG